MLRFTQFLAIAASVTVAIISATLGNYLLAGGLLLLAVTIILVMIFLREKTPPEPEPLIFEPPVRLPINDTGLNLEDPGVYASFRGAPHEEDSDDSVHEFELSLDDSNEFEPLLESTDSDPDLRLDDCDVILTGYAEFDDPPQGSVLRSAPHTFDPNLSPEFELSLDDSDTGIKADLPEVPPSPRPFPKRPLEEDIGGPDGE